VQKLIEKDDGKKLKEVVDNLMKGWSLLAKVVKRREKYDEFLEKKNTGLPEFSKLVSLCEEFINFEFNDEIELMRKWSLIKKEGEEGSIQILSLKVLMEQIGKYSELYMNWKRWRIRNRNHEDLLNEEVTMMSQENILEELNFMRRSIRNVSFSLLDYKLSLCFNYSNDIFSLLYETEILKNEVKRYFSSLSQFSRGFVKHLNFLCEQISGVLNSEEIQKVNQLLDITFNLLSISIPIYVETNNSQVLKFVEQLSSKSSMFQETINQVQSFIRLLEMKVKNSSNLQHVNRFKIVYQDFSNKYFEKLISLIKQVHLNPIIQSPPTSYLFIEKVDFEHLTLLHVIDLNEFKKIFASRIESENMELMESELIKATLFSKFMRTSLQHVSFTILETIKKFPIKEGYVIPFNSILEQFRIQCDHLIHNFKSPLSSFGFGVTLPVIASGDSHGEKEENQFANISVKNPCVIYLENMESHLYKLLNDSLNTSSQILIQEFEEHFQCFNQILNALDDALLRFETERMNLVEYRYRGFKKGYEEVLRNYQKALQNWSLKREQKRKEFEEEMEGYERRLESAREKASHVHALAAQIYFGIQS